MTRPRTDDYASELREVIAALLSDGYTAATERLARIAYRRHEVVTRSEPSETLIAKTYKRDRFHCRYCGCRVIPTQVMRLVAEIFPDDFPYHPNWKGGQTHPAIPSRSATLDHVQPCTLGGTNDPGNLVCACWICNRVKGELTLQQLGWELKPIPIDDDWDGLTSYYRELWEIAGSPTRGDHQLWIRLFEG